MPLLRRGQPKRQFAQLVNFETTQPASRDDKSFNSNMLDVEAANSKHYNPHHFDPSNADYQADVRMSVRDELPSEIDSADVAEAMYK